MTHLQTPQKTDVQLVIFDLGRVMVRLVDGWKHACEIAGVPYVPGFDSPDPQINLQIHEHVKTLEAGKMSHEQWCLATGQLSGMPAEDVDRVLRVWLREPFEGYEDLLDELHARGLRTACLSNTNGVHWNMMLHGPGPHLLPLKKMHWQFASHIIGANKPDKAIYQHVENETKILGKNILFFDDLKANIEGAIACGWQAHLILPTPDPVTQVRMVLKQLGTI